MFKWVQLRGIAASVFLISSVSFAEVSDHFLNAVLYQQKASEYRALCYQAYNVAKTRLDRALRSRGAGKKLAVVTDVDETVLSNAAYQADLILKDQEYPTEYSNWIDAAVAEPVPGALEFFKYASGKGVRVFYVTNRKDAEKEATIQNLKKEGFPDVSEETVLTKSKESSKEERRLLIQKQYAIPILIGDNLIDLAQSFEVKESKARQDAVDLEKDQFGVHYIVLPNAMYGDWEKVVGDLKGLTAEEKRALRLKALKGFKS
jgi:5'-nucleotidase (lipoprotein e(P4) family)